MKIHEVLGGCLTAMLALDINQTSERAARKLLSKKPYRAAVYPESFEITSSPPSSATEKRKGLGRLLSQS